MPIFSRTTGFAAGAALALSLGWAAAANAAPLTACAGDELAGEWLVLYQLRDPEYCYLSVDAAGEITASDCYTKRQRPIREKISGTLALDSACAVTGDLDFSRKSSSSKAEKKGGKGKGKYGAFSVEAQLSEDRSTLVGLFSFRKQLSHATAQRTQ
jgi:hypothetical protein